MNDIAKEIAEKCAAKAIKMVEAIGLTAGLGMENKAEATEQLTALYTEWVHAALAAKIPEVAKGMVGKYGEKNALGDWRLILSSGNKDHLVQGYTAALLTEFGIEAGTDAKAKA